MNDAHQKVQASHLKRNAYIYIRQSTLRQVFENTESTKRQYGLRQRAMALGWPEDRIIVIDCDLGQSGASSVDREGFQRLVAEVGVGHAGIVLGLEVSRLARNSTDWHRLLEICAITQTLFGDEDGIYDPAHFNDRLLLGLKGTMSEAELHVLRARLHGGILNKARRGELGMRPPVGLAYNPQGVLALDPDQQVQHCLRWLFETFRRTGSATATAKTARQQGLAFPHQCHKGPDKGILWASLDHSQVLRILHNPRYAGAFVYGRTHSRKNIDGGSTIQRVPRDQWDTLIPDANVGYISWEEYEQNQKCLSDSAQACGADRRKGSPREGPAILQGLVICGRCGNRMTIRYHSRNGQLCPEYVCQRNGIEHAEPICQRIPGVEIDQAIGALLVEAVNPMALEVSLAVQKELQNRTEETDRLRHMQVERVQYEADLAQRRYMRVDPDNRLVADSLEADWNHKLRALDDAQQEYEQRCKQDSRTLTEEQRTRIVALASDFPRLWRDKSTPDRERKRMTRLLLEDVTLNRGQQITLQIRFKGGAHKTLNLPLPLANWQQSVTPASVVEEIDHLLDHHTGSQIAAILNARGTLSGAGKPFHAQMVARIQRTYGLKLRYDRLRETGLLTLQEAAVAFQVSPIRLKIWLSHGLVRGHAYSDKNECLYEPPGSNPPRKAMGVKLSLRRPDPQVVSDRTEEVQYET